tara:strand:- start:511 stop:639 length:129 start_codon:yes stop_codon:yes gene_type:complete
MKGEEGKTFFPFRFSQDNKLSILIILWILDKLIMILLLWAMK